MGLLCSKCCLKSFGAGKQKRKTSNRADGTIEFPNSTEKSTHFGGKFTRRKVAKKRPVISAPRPVNPVHLNGRKWKHVIVTIPIIDEPPIPPARKKRKPCSRKVDTLAAREVDVDTADATAAAAAGSSKKPSFFEIMSAIQLRRCLRVLQGAGDDGDGGEAAGHSNGNGDEDRVLERVAAVPDDLFSTFLHGNETAIMVFAASLPFNIDYTKNRSLTNELNDSFFDNANACGCSGSGSFGGSPFKKNLIFLQTSSSPADDDLRRRNRRHPAKRDLDKLKFREICQPTFEQRINANCIEIRASASRDNPENRTPPVHPRRHPSCYVFVTRNINRRRAPSIKSRCSSQLHRHQQSNSLNVKNISNKTNQKPNNMYSSSSTNIEKVSDEMKKTLDENVPPPPPSSHLATTTSSPPQPPSDHCHIRENHLTSGIPVDRLCCIVDDSKAPAERDDQVTRLNSDQSRECTKSSMKNCSLRSADDDDDDQQRRDRDSDTSSIDSLTEFTYSLEYEVRDRQEANSPTSASSSSTISHMYDVAVAYSSSSVAFLDRNATPMLLSTGRHLSKMY